MNVRASSSSAALVLALFALLGSARAAFAQEEPPPPPPPLNPETSGIGGQNTPAPGGSPGGTQAFSNPSELFSGRAGAFFGLGFSKIDGDFFISTIINTDFSVGPVGVGLALPIDLLLINDDNTGTRAEKTYGNVLRRKDWNQVEDYFKFIRYVRYGQKRDPFYALVGQMWGSTIGHGTLLSRYTNSLNQDHPKFGGAFDLNTMYAGVETLADSFVNPQLIAARAYWRPFGGTPIARGWSVAVTGIMDRQAPSSLQFTSKPDGTLVLQSDAAGTPLVAVSAPFYAIGVDTEYELIRSSLLTIIPYVDANRLVGAGNGLHIGVLTDVSLPVPIISIVLQTRLEYRWMKPGYIPEYFDQTYDLGRYQYAVLANNPGDPAHPMSTFTPKSQAAYNDRQTGGVPRKGYYGELAFNFGGFVQVGGVLQDYQGDNGASLGIFATLPKIQIVKLSGYYLRKNFSGISDTFTLDERSLLAFSAAYKVFGPLYLRIDYTRQWVLNPNNSQIVAVSNFSGGIATYLPF